MDKHAYINIEPNNGGIVLNVSDGGLCFHSFDPVSRNGTVRFWFSDNGHRIEAGGTLAWTDETQKGGLRFASLPAEAREKIHDWMGHPVAPVPTGGASAPLGSSVPNLTDRLTETKVVSGISSPLAVVSPELKMARPLTGFSQGLATGLLVSAIVVAIFAFNNYRHEFGESLIRLGERFAAKPGGETVTVSAASPAVVPTAQVVSAAPHVAPPTTPAVSPVPPRVSPSPEPSQAARSEKVLKQPEVVVRQLSPNPANAQQAKVEPATPIPAETKAVGDAAGDIASYVSTSPKAPAPGSTPPTISSPTTTPATAPTTQPMTAGTGAADLSAKLGPAARVEPSSQSGVHSEGSTAWNADSARELYFEVGKFKNAFQAHDESDKLAQLGFPVTAVQKGFLWTNSVHILVGPYSDEEKAKVTQDNLRSDGFKPRPFEKGWRTFTFISTVTLNGARTPEGDYTISWESYIGDANVKLTRNNSVVATADGKWVKRETKYPRDAYVYRRNADGSRTLLEIHFGGMRQALVFGKAS